jgi:hypothetical protein
MHETPRPTPECTPTTADTPRTRKRGGNPRPGARQAKARERFESGANVVRLTVISDKRGVPQSTSRDAAARGAFPIARFGKAVYVRPPDFDRWLDNQFATRGR